VSTDMTGATASADFRMLVIMRAAMRERVAVRNIVPLGEKKRRGIKRVMREIARPFERFAKVCRKRFKTAALTSNGQ
jgi:hypothetical protein